MENEKIKSMLYSDNYDMVSLGLKLCCNLEIDEFRELFVDMFNELKEVVIPTFIYNYHIPITHYYFYFTTYSLLWDNNHMLITLKSTMDKTFSFASSSGCIKFDYSNKTQFKELTDKLFILSDELWTPPF